MGQLDHRLAGGHDLPGFRRRLLDDAVRVGDQHGVIAGVGRDSRLRLRGRQLRARAAAAALA